MTRIAKGGCEFRPAGVPLPLKSRVATLPRGIMPLDPNERQALRHWLDKTVEETPEMLGER